ncbi:MAG: sigma-70 family RNA polymerase sigma factor [Candidatus Hydrogenedentes bacterium]|nr:sigma-70 family RNA polymerase sigma factor [Candidatus Hydrogenedentota bacterium]
MAAIMTEPAVDENALVTSAQSGCLTSFESLYRMHSGRVHGLCLRLTGNAAAAEDLTQETFIRAWRNLGGFRGDSSFGSWLFRIAVNAVAARYRTELRRAACESNAPARSVQFDPTLRLDLQEAISTLPAGARAVFVLHDVEGCRHEEIAEQLGVAVGTSKAQLHHARRLLREMIQP